MRHEIVMPQMGESITTGTITKWHKNVGDKIELDETLLEISTDKVESEIPSPIGGVIVEILFKEGETVDVQKLIAVIEDDTSAAASAPAAKAAPAAAPAAAAPAAQTSAPAASGGERFEIVMPQMGESITTGTITKWHKKVGDKIDVDETLLEISTDKVESEIPSPYAGTVLELLYKEGDTVDVQKLIAVIGEAGAAAPAKAAAAPAASTQATVTTAAPKAAAPAAQSQAQTTDDRFYTPLVKAMAKEAGVPLAELANLKGTGAAGRVNKADFEAYVAGGRKSAGAPAAQATSQASAPKAAAPTAPASFTPAYGKGERVEIVPMTNIRKTIARNMQQSKLTAPHVNSIDEVDMTNLVKFREGFKKQFEKEEGFALTYTHFILYAIVQALKEFPIVNSSVDGDNIVYKKDINLGCAVAVPGQGLVVPVIKGADNLNLRGLARALDVLVTKAKAKKLTMEDMSGGTYTFTNNGSFGILAATPVILQPQVAIFCVGTIAKRPIVTKDDAIAIRQMMYATHTYDHRVIDGDVGSKFLRHVINTLQTMDPSGLF